MVANNKIEKVQVTCIDSGKVIESEILDVRADRITVILPGFNKLTLYKKEGKPNLYVASQYGMEFHTTYKRGG